MSRFVIADSMLCIDYHTCEAAYSETHRRHGLQSMPRLRAMLSEKESTPQLCHHCEDAPCAMACSVDTITRVDDAVQLNKSLCVGYKLCGITYPFGAVKFSDSRPLDVPTNVDTPKTPPTPPAPARVSTLLDQVPGIRTVAIKCDLYSFDEQGPACVRMYPTRALRPVDNTDIARVNKRKRGLTFNTDFGDLTLFQQVQSGEAR